MGSQARHDYLQLQSGADLWSVGYGPLTRLDPFLGPSNKFTWSICFYKMCNRKVLHPGSASWLWYGSSRKPSVLAPSSVFPSHATRPLVSKEARPGLPSGHWHWTFPLPRTPILLSPLHQPTLTHSILFAISLPQKSSSWISSLYCKPPTMASPSRLTASQEQGRQLSSWPNYSSDLISIWWMNRVAFPLLLKIIKLGMGPFSKMETHLSTSWRYWRWMFSLKMGFCPLQNKWETPTKSEYF